MKTVLQRFDDKIDENLASDCWLWDGAKTPGGYGLFYDGKLGSAHRWSYEYTNGKVPAGMQIDHLCRVRGCVNPDHMEVVTQQENIKRGDCGKHHTNKTHCPYGHPYSGDNLYISPKSGSRACKICARNYNRVIRKKARRGQSRQK